MQQLSRFQCSFIETLFIYHYVGDFIWQYFYSLYGKDRASRNILYDIYDIYEQVRAGLH